MPTLAKRVTVSISDDGHFKLESDTGNVSNYTSTELILVLEEVVKQFRGESIKITGVSRNGKNIVPSTESVNIAPPTSPSGKVIDADRIGELYHNGGLGPRIQPGDADNGLGFGVK